MPDDNLIRIGVVADVSQLTAPMQQGAVTVQAAFERIAASANAAGNVVMAQAAKFQAQGLSAIEASQALRNLDFSEKEVTDAMAAMAQVTSQATAATEVAAAESAQLSDVVVVLNQILGELSERTAQAGAGMRGMAGATSQARVEMGLAEGSAGMMASGLARVAAQSQFLAPIITAAFPAFAAIALIDILARVFEGFSKVTDSVMGYTAAVEKAEKEDVKASDAALVNVNTLIEAQQRLHEVIAAQGNIAQESYGEKFATAMEHAYAQTSALWGPLQGLVMTYRALTHAEADAADESVRLRDAQDKIAAKTLVLGVEADHTALKLVELKEAAEAAGKEHGDAGRVQSIRAEIAALADKQRIEEDIAAKESAEKGGGPADQTAARTVVAEEYYLRRIALTKDLSTAEGEAATESARKQEELRKKREEQYVEGIKLAATYRESLEAIHALETTPLKITVDESGLQKLVPFTKTEAETMVATFGTASVKMAQDAAASAREETAMFEAEEDKRGAKALETADKRITEEQRYATASIKSAQDTALADVTSQESRLALQKQLADMRIAASPEGGLAKARDTSVADNQELAQLRTFEQQKLQIKLDALNQEKAVALGGRSETSVLAGDDTATIAKLQSIYQQIAALKQQSAQKIEQIDGQIVVSSQKAADAELQAFTKATSQINSQFTSNFDQVIRGTETVRFAFIRMGGDLVTTMANNMEKMVVQQLSSELRMTLSHATGEQARVVSTQTASAETQAIEARTALSSITHSAASAAGKAYDAVAGIPIVGPELAVVAAATAFAGVMAFGALAGAAEQGAIVPKDMMVLAHQNEMILPAKYSQVVQDAADRRGNVNSGGGGGETHNHNYNFSALDTRGLESFLHKNKKQFVKLATGAVRNGFRIRR